MNARAKTATTATTERPVTPAQPPAGKTKRKTSPKAAKRPQLDATAQQLAEAPVRVATYAPSVFLETEYAAYALKYFTRCAMYDCPGRPEHAEEGAAAAYLHLISRNYGKTKHRITSHLHALRSAKYQARRRNWYAPQREDRDNRSKEKRQYCPGMGSAYQYGANPSTIFWAIEKAERTEHEFAEMTGRPRRDAIWEGSRTENKRGLPLHTREVALTYAREILNGPRNYRLPIHLESCTIEEA